MIADRPGFDPRRWLRELPPMDLFGALLFQVVGQQLSVAATRRTVARLEARFSSRLPSAAEVLGADPAQLRDAACPGARSARCGISPDAGQTGGLTRKCWPRGRMRS